MSRDALRQRIMDALSKARCPQWNELPGCDGLVGGCEDCLRLAADAVLRVAMEEAARLMCSECAAGEPVKQEPGWPASFWHKHPRVKDCEVPCSAQALRRALAPGMEGGQT